MDPEVKRRPGGRSAQVRHQVLAAAMELADSGQPVTVATVAKRSQVSEVTIYRRWRTADDVLLDAAVSDIGRQLPVAHTGDLRSDLVAWAEGVERSVRSPLGRRLLAALVRVNLDDPSASRPEAGGLMRSRRDELQLLLDTAEPATALTVETVLDGVLAPLHLRVLFGYDGPSTAARLVDALLVGG